MQPLITSQLKHRKDQVSISSADDQIYHGIFTQWNISARRKEQTMYMQQHERISKTYVNERRPEIVYAFISYEKFNKRQNYLMKIEVRIVITSGWRKVTGTGFRWKSMHKNGLYLYLCVSSTQTCKNSSICMHKILFPVLYKLYFKFCKEEKIRPEYL